MTEDFRAELLKQIGNLEKKDPQQLMKKLSENSLEDIIARCKRQFRINMIWGIVIFLIGIAVVVSYFLLKVQLNHFALILSLFIFLMPFLTFFKFARTEKEKRDRYTLLKLIK